MQSIFWTRKIFLNARRSLYSACMRFGRSNFTKVITLLCFRYIYMLNFSSKAQFFFIISFVVGVPFVYGNLCRWIGCWQSSNLKSMISDIMTSLSLILPPICSIIDTLKNSFSKMCWEKNDADAHYKMLNAESFYQQVACQTSACHLM